MNRDCPQCHVPEGAHHRPKCSLLLAKLNKEGFETLEAYVEYMKKENPRIWAMMHGRYEDN